MKHIHAAVCRAILSPPSSEGYHSHRLFGCLSVSFQQEYNRTDIDENNSDGITRL